MTEILLSALLIILLVALVILVRSLLSQKERAAKSEAEATLLRDAQVQKEAAHATALQAAEERHARETALLNEQHKQERDALTAQHKQEREALVTQHTQDKAEQERRHQEAIVQQQQRHEQERKAQQEQWEERLKMLSLQFDKLSHEHLATQREELKKQNSESITQLLSPLKLSVDTFQKDFAERMGNQGKENAAMQEVLKTLSQQTERVGNSADGLTNALKGGNKIQGNWGEGVLSNILAASGLTAGRDYETQVSITAVNGKQYIPDVVVKYGSNQKVIIDAKTSLTAYLEYMRADNDADRERYLKAHVSSVRTHVKELAAKAYPKKTEGALDYVLMFIPNEGSYIAAVNAEFGLVTEAFEQHVVIVNPTNLLITLRLIHLFGQKEQQTKNVNDIITAAKSLYEKFASFSDSFVDIGERIGKLSAVYTKANDQLREGRGNFAGKLEKFRDKGLIVGKEINAKLLEREVEEEKE